MSNQTIKTLWASGDAYEPYVGRWSRLVARTFLEWLRLPPGLAWLDVGCGTGALTETILDMSAPREVAGMDPSEGFVAYARERIRDSVATLRATFTIGNAMSLPFDTSSRDVIVSGLVLNFIPDQKRALGEMTRVVRPGGTVAAYVWDYAGEMQLMRYFWEAAVALDPAASALYEGIRFPICKPEALKELFMSGGLTNVRTQALDIPTHFRDFDDYWSPFLGGQGPAPSYAMSLTEERRAALRDYIRAQLPIADDDSIRLMARAWAVAGSR